MHGTDGGGALSRARVATVGLLVLLLGVVAGVVAPAAHADPGADTLAALVDDERAARGLPPLTHVVELRAVAQRRAERMASSGVLSHDPPVSGEVSNWSKLSENVARGLDLDGIHAALMASSGHRANLLDTGVSQLGVGVAWDGRRLWVSQVFRAPTGEAVHAEPVPPPFTPPAACGSSPPAGFSDVRPGAWYAGAVDCAVARDLVQGTTASTFSPRTVLTRGQAASLLYRVALRSSSRSTAEQAPDAFGDDTGSPHEQALNGLAALGVMQGTSPGVSSLHADVTRAQITSLLVRLHERLADRLPTSGVRFADASTGPHVEAIDKATTARITTGTTSRTFSPDVAVRRDLVSVLLVRTWAGLRERGALT